MGIAGDHDSLRTKLKATGCLQSIGCAQAMLRSEASGLLNHCSGELNPQEVGLGKQGIKKRTSQGSVQPVLKPGQALINDVLSSSGAVRRWNVHTAQI